MLMLLANVCRGKYLIDLVSRLSAAKSLSPTLAAQGMGAPRRGLKAPCLLGGILHGLKPVPSTDKPNISFPLCCARNGQAGVAGRRNMACLHADEKRIHFGSWISTCLAELSWALHGKRRDDPYMKNSDGSCSAKT